MPIHILREGELYSAKVTPPHADVEWASPRPMSAQQLYNALLELGCHPVDIMDALSECNPEWERREPNFRT
ncbi:MAG TPA: hypothetical protein VH866_03155 [Candidatus Deferrimicrobiaceae bacterium]|jgi:hypothetical protein